MEVTRQQFLEQRHRRFGTVNPERMDVPFWETMVRNGKYAYWARKHFEAIEAEGPVWCFNRFGMSQTTLADGRTLCVAGEHEDFYDPDFCIYNDVIVKLPDGRIEIFGYPREVFPPTDFHTATLTGDRLILIGSLGYQDEREPGVTPVYELSLSDFRIMPVCTKGDVPGWISRHEAELSPAGRIVIRGGEVMTLRDGQQKFRRNADEFSLDLTSGRWNRLTQHNWREFSIRPDPQAMLRLSLRQTELLDDALLPSTVSYSALPTDEWRETLLEINGVRVMILLNSHDIRVIAQGPLPPDV